MTVNTSAGRGAADVLGNIEEDKHERYITTAAQPETKTLGEGFLELLH